MCQPDASTIAYYDQHADAFVESTVGASMTDALMRFAGLLPAGGHVLDWGCGSGRDSLVLREWGFEVVSVDASPVMAAEAFAATGTTVRVESFDQLKEIEAYHGIWACASLLHVKPDDLPIVLQRAARALKQGGVLYCSFKQGHPKDYRNGRWFTCLTEGELMGLMTPCFDVVSTWESGDVRRGRGDELWLNCLATKR